MPTKKVAKKKAVVKKDSCCNHGGIEMGLFILGVLIIVNAVYSLLSWPMFIGGIIGLKGLILMMKQ